jgi:hypothetical protein
MGCLNEDGLVSFETGTNFMNWSVDMKIMPTVSTLRNRDSSAGKTNRLRAARSKSQDSSPGRDKGYFLFSKILRPSLESTQPPLQWVQERESKDT